MYVLLYGTKKNAGDYLIYERARELLRVNLGTEDFLELPRWEKLDQHLDIINRKAKAVIICGGPGYDAAFYPRIFPSADRIDDIHVPIIPMALGWSGQPMHNPDVFKFTEQSQAILQQMHTKIHSSSVRDVITKQILNNAGINNVTVTGCAAWYYLPMIDQDFEPPKNINHVVVTSPAKNTNMAQAAELLRLVKQRFAHATRYLVFHRGIFPDKYTNLKTGLYNTRLAMQGIRYGYRVIDASYSTKRIEFYKNCDLHIGYRVHAHLDFLSYRKASILLQEDGRGVGQSVTLGTQDVAADHPHALGEVDRLINHHLDTHFTSFSEVVSRMRAKHPTMLEFIQSIGT